MNIHSLFSKSILLFISLIIGHTAISQRLNQSRQTSYYTFIYKLTDKEAAKIYKNDIWIVDASFFHTLVDSFPTDSLYTGKLPEGHYLRTYSEKDKQKLFITTVGSFDVFILDNNTDLSIQVYDLQGKIIKDADVKIRSKKLHFDKKTHAYVDKKSNRKGILKVTVNNFTAFYSIKRKYNNSFAKRGMRKVLYGTPLKYVWVPVRFVIYLPIDGVKSIVNHYPHGTIYKTKDFFVRSFYTVACKFDDYYCDEYYPRKRPEDKYTGYLVFNKPKYQPGDTVKFKAFLVTKKGKTINEPVKVVLETSKKDIVLTTLNPYSKGAYEYQFPLHDSLQLQLDRNYTISLGINDSRICIRNSFTYEDYELTKAKLLVRMDETEQYHNKDFKLFIKGTDENGLNLLDARFEILAKPKTITSYLGKQVFIPDTLLYLQKKLEPTDETEVLIPDSSFPKANFDYDISIKLLTSDNEVISENKSVDYFYKSEKFVIELPGDSIEFLYFKDGVTEKKKAIITANDNFGNKTRIFEGNLPYKTDLNPFYSDYTVTSDSLSKNICISSEPTLLQCFSERTGDSVTIVMDNPRKIPFSYNIYRKNAQQWRGFADSLNLKQKSKSKQNYFVSIQYLWAGEIKAENYRIPLVDKKLNISVTQPPIVFPGQKTRIEVLVTDIDGKPVENVDLTAYSLTKKFNYAPPELPYLGASRKNKNIINTFSFLDIELGSHNGMNLDYGAWKLLAGIDSIEYYKFLYPGNAIYRFEYKTSDSLTQFAPFVMSKGAIKPVHVIYVDSKPVYFSWSTNAQPYSFKISEGYHQVKLRTSEREIIMDSLYFKKGSKLIFSLNQDSAQKQVRTGKVKPALSLYEKRLLYQYIFPYRNNFGEKYAYIEHGDDIQFLSPKSGLQSRYLFAGPASGNISFHIIDGFSTNFYHEPFFEYDFAPELLKMRSVAEIHYPSYLYSYGDEKGLNDVVLTKNGLNTRWKSYLDSKRMQSARYVNPGSTSQGQGKLLFAFSQVESPVKDIPLNILVFRHDDADFLRIYPGNTVLIHELAEGYHKLIFFYPGSRYHVVDSVYIKPNGLNYFEFPRPQAFKKDNFSVYVSNLIEESLFKPDAYYGEKQKELKQVNNMYQQEFRYAGNGEMVEGYVYSTSDGGPIPGVTVMVKGTTFGTLTDLNGYYALKIPANHTVLSFSFIGFETLEKSIGSTNIVNSTLKPQSNNLEEVVVIGYGTVRKSSLTGSAVSVASQSLLAGGIPGMNGNISNSLTGKVAGVQVTMIKGSPGGPVQISIRGASSIDFSKTPLYIVNGKVFTGDIAELDPALILNISILKGQEATAIYGTQAANGVVIIETKAGTFKSAMAQANKGTDFDNAFFEAVSQSSSIRESFSDYAFWQPKLTTDKAGKAGFEVTFPDDVTSWETYYLAMNGKKQSGQTKSQVKSYKPLMAQLAVPRFLVESDTAFAIGKVLNYSPDSVNVTTGFEINHIKKSGNTRYCVNSLIDTLSIIATDSLSVKYSLERADGYFDGELREIPVFPLGLEETKGNFYALDYDTTFKLSSDTALGKVSLYARADILDVIGDEISKVIHYQYSCNEQIASKLKALLAEKSIAKYKGEKFNHDNDIEKLIKLLRKNQKDNGLWGWWKNSDNSGWISLHVLEALSQADKQGYDSHIDKGQLREKLIWEVENSRDPYSRIKMLKILRLLNSYASYGTYITELEKTKDLSFNGFLQIIELKQLCSIDIKVDTLKAYQKSTLFGNVYFTDEKRESNLLNRNFNLLDNDIQNTLLAYKILKADTADNRKILGKIRNYFFESRKTGYWRNTYESAQIIETILPDLLGKNSRLSTPILELSGDVSKTITKFPFKMEVSPNQAIEITKTGDFPIYFTNYQRYWNKMPKATKGDFEITTHFNNDSASILKAGNETILIAEVIIKKDAEYVMINIPVPGGCSYTEKKTNSWNESNREYFKNETTIFCERLTKGKHTFEVKLMPRYSGKYALNPAKVELMYFPVFNANNDSRRIGIK